MLLPFGKEESGKPAVHLSYQGGRRSNENAIAPGAQTGRPGDGGR